MRTFYSEDAAGASFSGRFDLIHRHNIIRDAIHGTASQAALSPRKEESALLPGSTAKPADVYLPGWANGKDAALDVTVVSTLQAALVKKAGEEVGSAANKRHQEKQAKYWQACANEGIEFLPMVVETLGGWHPEASEVVTKLAQQL